MCEHVYAGSKGKENKTIPSMSKGIMQIFAFLELQGICVG
jgi:hypothetical protein